MNERHLLFSALYLALAVAMSSNLGTSTASGESLDVVGQVIFSDGEIARYRVVPNGVLVVSDGSGAVYFFRHGQRKDNHSFYVQGFVEKTGMLGFAPLPLRQIDVSTSVDVPGSGKDRDRKAFELRMIGFEDRSQSSTPEFDPDFSNSICCVPCGGRYVCSTEVNTSCGSCGPENLL
jgi:hypothetical protein